MNIISFDLDSVEKSFLEELLKYKEAKENVLQIKGNIESLLSEINKERNFHLIDICNCVVTKNFSHVIMGKLKFVFDMVDVLTLTNKIFSDLDLDVGMELGRKECQKQVELLKSLIQGDYISQLPDEKFVNDFVQEIDVILSKFSKQA